MADGALLRVRRHRLLDGDLDLFNERAQPSAQSAEYAAARLTAFDRVWSDMCDCVKPDFSRRAVLPLMVGRGKLLCCSCEVAERSLMMTRAFRLDASKSQPRCSGTKGRGLTSQGTNSRILCADRISM